MPLTLLIEGAFPEGKPESGARAVPAADLQSAPGRLRGTAWRVKGPVCEELAGLDRPEAGKTPAPAASQETPEGERAPHFGVLPRADWFAQTAYTCLRCADNGWMRLSALRFPRPLPRDANELRNGFAKLGRGRATRTNFFSSPRDKLGIACIAGKVWNNNHSLTPDIFDSDNEDDAGPKREET